MLASLDSRPCAKHFRQASNPGPQPRAAAARPGDGHRAMGREADARVNKLEQDVAEINLPEQCDAIDPFEDGPGG
jgi:hypothetical protein